MLNVPAPRCHFATKSAGAAGLRLTRLGSAGFASFGLLAWSTTSWAVRVVDDGDQHIPRLRSFIAFPAAARPPNRSRRAAPPTTRTTDGGSRHPSLRLSLYIRLGRGCYYKALLICALMCNFWRGVRDGARRAPGRPRASSRPPPVACARKEPRPGIWSADQP
jgi:hypothetical protein